jgi:hypothetical protein
VPGHDLLRCPRRAWWRLVIDDAGPGHWLVVGFPASAHPLAGRLDALRLLAVAAITAQ